MQKNNYWDFSPEKLRDESERIKKQGKILLIIGICTLPFFVGLLFLFLSLLQYNTSKMYIKIATKKEDGTFTPPPFLNNDLTDYVIFDFETTGLSPKTDRIIEVAALKVRGGQVVDTFSSLVNPQKNITKRVTTLTGITPDLLQDSPLEEEVMAGFVPFIKGSVITSYNVNFDISFLDASLQRLGVGLGNVEYFDSLKVARDNFSGLENHKLETVAQFINPDFVQKHRALDDCFAVKLILDNVKLTKDISR